MQERFAKAKVIIFSWAVLLTVMALFSVEPFRENALGYLKTNTEIKKELPLEAQKAKVDSILLDSIQQAAFIEILPKKPMDTTAQRILVGGDSMSECLLYGLRNYAQTNGHKIKSIGKAGTSTIFWAEKDTLEEEIKKFNPTLVIFCIGANELTIPNIAGREKHIKKIISKFDGLKYIWVSPPNWTEDTGLTELIKANVPEGQLFISKDLVLERRRDGAHPTFNASLQWSDTLARWIELRSEYPICLNKPEKHLQLKATNDSTKLNSEFLKKSSASAIQNSLPANNKL